MNNNKRTKLLAAALLVGGGALLAGVLTVFGGSKSDQSPGQVLAIDESVPNTSPADLDHASPKASTAPVVVAAPPEPSACAPDALKVGIKHYRYQEASAADLVDVGNGHRLHRDAAAAFDALREAARKDGVTLTLGSAFRSVEHQRGIVERKKAKGQTDQEIYYVSSAPGFSEHHTGFTVDFSPIEYSFERTAAYKWLNTHAPAMGWQQSFTPESSKVNGVSYEPWHWKYLGSPAAQAALSHGTC